MSLYDHWRRRTTRSKVLIATVVLILLTGLTVFNRYTLFSAW